MQKRILKVFMITYIVLLLHIQISCQKTDPLLYFGTSKVDITPDAPVMLCGYPVDRITKDVNDRLYCRVSAFRKNNKRLVLISCDLVGFFDNTYEFISEKICKNFDLKPDEIFLAGTHTHSGPLLVLEINEEKSGLIEGKYEKTKNYQYTMQLTDSILEATKEALNTMMPVSMGIGRGYAQLGINRRIKKPDSNEWPYDGGFIKMGRNKDGPVDNEVLILKIVNNNRRPLGIIYNYASHARSQNMHSKIISGDFFGISEQFVEKHMGNNAIASIFAGASGDIDPLYVTDGFIRKNGWIPETEQMGTMLGTEVVHTGKEIRADFEVNSIKTDFYQIKLPARKHNEYKTDKQLPKEPLNITVAALGELAVIGLSCEALVEVGLAIKKASPFRYNFIITHCNGGSGYLPPAYMYEERGYEVMASPFGPEAADMVVDKTVALLKKLR